MSIAIAILLFIVGVAFLIMMLEARDGGSSFAAFLAAGLSIAGGVLNIVSGNTGIHIAIGVWLCLLAVASLLLLLAAAVECLDGDVPGILVGGAVLLAGWVTTFAVLQLTIVV